MALSNDLVFRLAAGIRPAGYQRTWRVARSLEWVTIRIKLWLNPGAP